MKETNEQLNLTGKKLASAQTTLSEQKQEATSSSPVKSVEEPSVMPIVNDTPKEKKVEKLSLANKILMVQLNMKAMTRDQQGYGYKYFDINQIIEHLKPLLKEYGLLVLQPLTHIDGKPAIETRIISSDDQMSWVTPLPTNTLTYITKTGQQFTETDPQKMGAVITYYRRYALQSLFMLQAEDNDGKTHAEITNVESKVEELKERISNRVPTKKV